MIRLRTMFKGQKVIVVCSVVLAALFIIMALAPWLAPHDPVKVNLLHKLEGPSKEYWLGTDHLGRCNLS
ncbi:nickel ABC transporter permease subunit NikC, partial [Bacillus cereus]|nr:nickel ABC transporter permease subunit NikC [Bacillus cereus]